MAENNLSTKEKICDAALALLRQDIGYATSMSIQAKCDNVWALAEDTVRSAHVWSKWKKAADVEDGIPVQPMLRQLLVYSMARELAIPVTGRQEDLKTIDALYQQKLEVAVAKDLEDEMIALRAEDDEDSRFAAEVLDILRQYHSTADGKRAKPQSRGIAQMVDHINSIKPRIRVDVLMTHDWSFATEEQRVHSRRLDDGRWSTQIPGDALKVIKCYSDRCEKAESFIRNGEDIVTYAPLERIVFLYDDGTTKYWTHTARRAYLYRVVQAVALASPELVSNPARMQEIDRVTNEAVQTARTTDARQTHLGTSAYGRNYLYDVAVGRRRVKWMGRRR